MYDSKGRITVMDYINTKQEACKFEPTFMTRLVNHKYFDNFIVLVICINAILLGMEHQERIAIVTQHQERIAIALKCFLRNRKRIIEIVNKYNN